MRFRLPDSEKCKFTALIFLADGGANLRGSDLEAD